MFSVCVYVCSRTTKLEETKAFCICNPIIPFILGIQQIYFPTNILGPR